MLVYSACADRQPSLCARAAMARKVGIARVSPRAFPAHVRAVSGCCGIGDTCGGSWRRPSCFVRMPGWRDGLHEAEGSVRTTGAPRHIDLGDAPHEGINRLNHGRVGRWHVEGAAAERQLLPFVAIGQQTVVADALEPGWQHVRQKAADEGVARQAFGALLARMVAITHAKQYLAVAHGDQSFVGNGGLVRIAAEVVEHLGRSAQRFLGIDDPVMTTQRRQQAGPVCAVAYRAKTQRVARLLERIDELLAEHLRQGLDRKQEVRLAVYPLSALAERTVGHQRVHMQVAQQVLGPRMKYQRQGQRAAEPTRIGAEFEQRLRARGEQDVGDEPEVAAGQAVQCVRNSKHQVHIGHRQ